MTEDLLLKITLNRKYAELFRLPKFYVIISRLFYREPKRKRMIHDLIIMKLKTFEQGIHPSYNKKASQELKIEAAALPAKVVIPLHQHTGATCEPLVEVGAEVYEGQKIGESSKFISASVHASISGKVTKIEKFPHPCGVNILSVVIEGQQIQPQTSNPPLADKPQGATPEEIRQAVKEAGIVGLGGAAFPTHVKLNPPKDKKIDTILINGCECEPYITADHRIMLERTAKVVAGANLIAQAAGASRVIFGIEDNKYDAITAIRSEIRKQHFPELADGIEVVVLETKYPQGGEKMLIKAALGREVPSRGLPLDVGVVVCNVGTAVAVVEAVNNGQPLIKRVLTVTGPGIKEPKNLLVRIGTSFQEIIEQCGGLNEEATKIIAGGPMMGVAQISLAVPVVKGTSCILVLRQQDIPEEKVFPCVKCATCVDHCPMFLVPTKLAALAENGQYSEFEQWGGEDCMECGCCAAVCPAKIPLVQLVKLAKLKLRQMK